MQHIVPPNVLANKMNYYCLYKHTDYKMSINLYFE